MASAQQIANSFVTEFFERLAKNPAGLAELYGGNSVLHIHDFEMGIKEIVDGEASAAAQEWAVFVQGSQLRVESVSAAAIHGGVNVFVTFTAVAELQQYFHVHTTLEVHTGFNVEGYFIRHQVISRIGAIGLEPQPNEQVSAVAERESLPQAMGEYLHESHVENDKEQTLGEQEEELPPQPVAVRDTEINVEAPRQPAETGKPKSWASLLSSSPKSAIDDNRPIRVVASSAASGTPVTGAATKNDSEVSAAKGSPKEYLRREKRPKETVGDRLMFKIDFVVTDDEIRGALASMEPFLLSLRNNSERGLVFMDFAADVKAFEELKKLSPVIGANKAKISVFRQRARD